MAKAASDRFLSPPGRFSHALVLALGLVIAFAMTTAIGHRGTLLVGLLALFLFIAGFWGFSRDEWLLTVVGTVLVVFGGVTLLLTPIFAGARAAATTSFLDGLLFRTVVPLALIAGVAALVLDVVPARVTDQDGPAFVGLWYTGGTATLLVAGVAAVQFGLAAVFGSSAGEFIALTQDGITELVTLNAFTGLGGLLLLAGVVFWMGPRVTGLPLLRRGMLRARLYWRVLRDRAAANRDQADVGPPRGQPPESHGDEAAQTDRPGDDDTQARSPFIDGLGTNIDWNRLARLLGILLFWGGFALIIAGIMPETASMPGYAVIAGLVGPLVGESMVPHRLVAGLAALLIGLRIGHILIWRAIHLNWATHQRRAAYLLGALIVLLGGAAMGGPLIEIIVSVPSLHLLPDGGTGPIMVVTEEGFEFREPAYGYVTLEQHSSVFVESLRNLVDIVGAGIVGIALVAVVVMTSLLVLVLVGLGGASTGLSQPGGGIGLLFVGTAGAAVLGAPTWDAVLAAGAALLAADANGLGASLQAQLDAAAPTLRGEVVHMTATAIVIAAVMVLVVAGTRLVSIIPTPPAEWQLFGALWLSILAAVISVLLLGFGSESEA